jgi:hypothetical protein
VTLGGEGNFCAKNFCGKNAGLHDDFGASVASKQDDTRQPLPQYIKRVSESNKNSAEEEDSEVRNHLLLDLARLFHDLRTSSPPHGLGSFCHHESGPTQLNYTVASRVRLLPPCFALPIASELSWLGPSLIFIQNFTFVPIAGFQTPRRFGECLVLTLVDLCDKLLKFLFRPAARASFIAPQYGRCLAPTNLCLA